jgi:hypothetical protein
MTQNLPSTPRGVSSVMLLVVFVTLALSVVALIFGSAMIFDGNASQDAWIMLGLGAVGIAISAYALFETRRRILALKIVIPPVRTTMECKDCKEKKTRDFQRGDYIFKEAEQCQKCNSKMMITAIYREATDKQKEKEKEKFPF